MPSFESSRQDLVVGARQLRRSPGFFAAAVITLALGVGANTTMFGVVYGVLLKPLPFEEPDRLVSVWSSAPGIGWPRAVLAAAQYFTYRDENRVFEDLAAWTERSVTVTGDAEPDRVYVLQVTHPFLDVLRVRPVLGRSLRAEDDAPGRPARALITYGFWQQRFGGAPGAVGRSLRVNGEPCEIIGVLPRGFRFGESKAVLVMPLAFDRAATRIQDFSYVGLARLKPGVTLEQANRDVGRMIPLVPAKFPASPALGPSWFADARFGPDVHLLSADAAGDVGPVLWVLSATIGLVLLIACANVANLFMVRADGRQAEFAVRAALGAGRWRLARALMAESVALGLAGGLVGIGLAAGAVRLVRRLAPDALPRVSEIGLHPVVILFGVVLSVAAGLLFGLVPVLRCASPRLAALADGGRAASAGRSRQRARSALVVAEIALALVLLVASGLMVRTFQAMRRIDPGFVAGDQVLTLEIALPRSLAAQAEQVARCHQAIAERLARLPGVQSVGMTSAVAVSGAGMSNPLLVEDFPQPEGQVVRSRRMKWIAPGYFETMGNRLLAGRALAWADVFEDTRAVLVSARLAREYWKTPSGAIGRRVRESAKSPWREIVGVVGDEYDDGLAQPPPPLIYYPYLVRNFWAPGITGQRSMSYVIRSSRAGTAALAAEVRRAVWSVDKGVPVANIRTLSEVVAVSMAQTSFALVMLAIAAAVSLLLGVVGIYGVVSYVVAQRTREVGVRMALGASPRDVVRLFLAQGAAMALAGVTIGAAAAAFTARLLSSMLFGVGPVDLATYAVTAALLGTVALLAAYVPARRAARMSPVAALTDRP